MYGHVSLPSSILKIRSVHHSRVIAYVGCQNKKVLLRGGYTGYILPTYRTTALTTREAVEFLAKILKNGKSVPATEVFNEAEEIGIAKITLKHAKANLKVSFLKTDKNQWVWELDKKLRT